jgi:hypothetical protein
MSEKPTPEPIFWHPKIKKKDIRKVPFPAWGLTGFMG